MLGEGQDDRRGDVQAGDAVVLDGGEELRQVEAGQDDDGGAEPERGVHEGGEAVDVEERQDGEDAVAGCGGNGRFELGEVGGDLPVGEHHALGGAGGARGVRQGRDVLGRVDRDGRFGGGRGQHVDERAVAGRAVADQDLLDAAREFGGAAGGVQQG